MKKTKKTPKEITDELVKYLQLHSKDKVKCKDEFLGLIGEGLKVSMKSIKYDARKKVFLGGNMTDIQFEEIESDVYIAVYQRLNSIFLPEGSGMESSGKDLEVLEKYGIVRYCRWLAEHLNIWRNYRNKNKLQTITNMKEATTRETLVMAQFLSITNSKNDDSNEKYTINEEDLFGTTSVLDTDCIDLYRFLNSSEEKVTLIVLLRYVEFKSGDEFILLLSEHPFTIGENSAKEIAERINYIRQLEVAKDGALFSITEIAFIMGLSEPTIRKYLNQFKKVFEY